MKNGTPHALDAVAIAIALLMLATPALAQVREFPAKPLRIIVPTAPGGIVDLVTRILGQRLTELTGQIAIVENKAGASTNIGMEFVARAPADGYTLLSTSLPLVVNPSVFPKLPFNVEKDFAPVSLVAAGSYVLVAHPSVPARSLRELVAAARANPGKFNYSSGGNGTNLHIAAELFRIQAGIDIAHVPYKGGGPALAAVVGGEADMSFPALGPALPQVNAGRLRALAVTASERSPLLPNVPTVAESGYPDYVFTSWVGILAPSATPAPLVATLNALIVKAMNSPGVIDRLAADGTTVIAGS
ncbi:MAG TPA: tripartite tricarboxylate transporter substrate binding protein, partial [Burkholderiales bacterium]|nr:tripartite tricarboxylate transporter substrate binding protein [Burkholderiales bacterium]